ncbi:MAG: cytochrome P450 [Actinomycetota bacterium]
MTERSVATVDLADPNLYQRGIPHDVFTELRRRPGLTWNAIAGDPTDGFWAVTRHDDLVTVSRDPDTFSSAVGHIQIYDIDEDALAARASMIDLDPPVHTRLRRLVSSAFTPRHVQGYRDAITERVHARLDALIEAGGGDWVDLVAAPIPIGVICDLMGVPEADHGYMIELSDHLVAGTSSQPLDPEAYGNTTDLRLLPFNSPAAHGINAYAIDLGERRRRTPEDDLITRLVEAEIEGDRLTDAEFANFFRLMIFAGNETTRSSIAHLALHLTHFGAAFGRVREDRAMLDSLVEEVIRYSSPILYFRRTATVDTELAGTPIAAGDKVVMWYASANFDEAQFPDPLTFDPARPTLPPHVAFGGGGAHFCLGASLARLELQILIDAIMTRNITIDVVGDPTFVDSNFVNGIEHLEVRLP